MTSFSLSESYNGVRARVGTKQVLQRKSFKICIPPRVISADLITMTVFCSTDFCFDPLSISGGPVSECAFPEPLWLQT